MSLRALLFAIDDPRVGQLPAAALRVLLVLADHAHDDGTNAHPKVANVATRLGLSVRTVQRHLAALQAAGLIRPGDPDAVPAMYARNARPQVWDLVLDARPEAVDNPVDRGDRNDTPRHAGVTDPAARGDTQPIAGVTPTVAHRTVEPRTNRPAAGPRRLRSIHKHEPNARRALAAVRFAGLTVDELLEVAYDVGDGDPWAGYLRVKAAANDGPPPDRVRDALALLRRRLAIA